jgi:hypothetical protein
MHGDRSNERLEALDVDDVRAAVADLAVKARSEVVVTPGRPCRDAPDLDPGEVFSPRQLSGRVRREHGHLHSALDEAARDLVDVHLHASEEREEPWRHHQDAKGAGVGTALVGRHELAAPAGVRYRRPRGGRALPRKGAAEDRSQLFLVGRVDAGQKSTHSGCQRRMCRLRGEEAFDRGAELVGNDPGCDPASEAGT